MRADVFLDTNVVVYAFDSDAPEKRRRSRALLAGRDWIISWQVLQELASVALHRFAVPLKPEDLRDYTSLCLWPRCRVLPSEEVYRKALQVHDRYGYRFYDSLIIASALAGGVKRLLSEDLQHGQVIHDLRIENPYRGP